MLESDGWDTTEFEAWWIDTVTDVPDTMYYLIKTIAWKAWKDGYSNGLDDGHVNASYLC